MVTHFTLLSWPLPLLNFFGIPVRVYCNPKPLCSLLVVYTLPWVRTRMIVSYNPTVHDIRYVNWLRVACHGQSLHRACGHGHAYPSHCSLRLQNQTSDSKSWKYWVHMLSKIVTLKFEHKEKNHKIPAVACAMTHYTQQLLSTQSRLHFWTRV